MTCRDCIHYDVCHNNFKNIDSNEEMTDEHCCADFKDKSRIIELPCKVGDDIYYITIDRNANDLKNLFGMIVKKADLFQILCILTIDERDKNYINNEVFFDKSKAEAKLKELNENGYIQNDKK